jgi:two-component system copper resistance phosphate regulon response regulator CusR
MSPTATILLVEDDAAIRRTVAKGLSELTFRLHTAESASAARHLLATEEIGLVVLDLGLPDGDGLDLLREIRAGGSTLPVIILTARDTITDKVAGLDLGADDYLVKPFAFQELSARIRAHLRRSSQHPASVLNAGDLTIDLVARSVQRAGRTIECTPREFDVLVYLVTNQGQPVSRQTLGRDVWKVQSRMTSMDNLIDVLMSRLREKIDSDHDLKLIRTVRGLGFMVKDGA